MHNKIPTDVISACFNITDQPSNRLAYAYQITQLSRLDLFVRSLKICG